MQNTKIQKLLIGTNNIGKFKEIRALLPKYIKTYPVSKFNLKSPNENGKTFKENSIIKSKYFSKKTNLICLADDSGLEIDLLNKKPGIYSARWAGKNSDFDKAIKRIYVELKKKDKNWKKKKLEQDLYVHYLLVYSIKKLHVLREKLKDTFHHYQKEKTDLVMIQYLFPWIKKKLLAK